MNETRGDRSSAMTATAMVATAVTAAVWTLWAGGLTPWGQDDSGATGQQPVAQAPRTQLELAPAPAAQFVQETMQAYAQEWTARGQVDGALPPHPLACTGQEHLTPVASASVSLEAGTPVQAYVAVYPAGLGAVELEQQVGGEHLRGCAAGASVRTQQTATIGTETHQVRSSWNGQESITRAWRHGDVVLYAVVDAGAGAALDAVSARMDQLATAALGTACVNPASSVEDADRSPLYATGYRPHTVTESVAITAPDLPPVPQELADTEPARRYPMRAYAITEVDPPTYPDYPVWPMLPEEVAFPEPLEAPEAPVTQTSIEVAVDDPDGPGCGWAFTGQVAPPFDPAAAAADREEAVERARTDLAAAAEQWQRDVLTYWHRWPTYEQAVLDYTRYADEVTEVRSAWEVIDAQWQAHEDAIRQYRRQVAVHEDALTRRARAQERYEAQVAQCTPPPAEVPTFAPAPEPTPEQTAGPDEVPTEAPTDMPTDMPTEVPAEEPDPTQPWQEPAGCPPQRPALLDEPEPVAPVPPAEPVDPRPQS